MFETCDWNDEGEGLIPSPAENDEKSSAQEKGTSSRKKRLKRNRQLQEVLRSLNTPSTLYPDLPPAPDTTTAKRRKKPAPGITSIVGHLPEVDPRAEEPPQAEEEHPSQSEERLSRRQWRNKLKNKKKSRNKFKVDSGISGQRAAEKRDTARDEGAGATAAPGEAPRNRRDRRKLKSQKSQGKQNGNVLVDRAEQTQPPPGSSAWKQPKAEHLRAAEPRTSAYGEGDRVTPQERARLRKLKKVMQCQAGSKATEIAGEEDPQKAFKEAEQPPEADNSDARQDRSAELRSRMEQRLKSARFRYINQQLYTSDSQDALNLFQQDPDAFTCYHTGFSQQVQRWPVNPITEIIKYIKNRPSSLVVADFGCGDALLARSVRNKVHSFDLVALNDHVTVCDMAKVPLEGSSVDVAVFCLSLMGKNLSDFLQEANRILKPGGVLLVAEVSSRFDDIRPFLNAMSQLGFKSINKNTENSYFFLFEFSKTGGARDASKHLGLQLKPCLYKKR
ncbi:ribosomal RNA-processing protein 8 [Bufo gargarizans]|uniref:ribosomal RNA-processing protein 8 n=1 Tax=Bufo gargarizans TaxID=30331 RepID=UPI001CF2C519|nr:ribosomal RNA-processing protein 8 [Bufo gargarizans]XP_044141518.1 ribosomal RNA-processing protein 8 [Bufo gargarizans]XP_044141519.1 ribosomal RNA-processing protein 8 [Bufo gargarizans]